MGSGGDRPDAPQNNPANISATGGAGQSGQQPVRYIPDMKSLGSTGVETMAQQTAAPLAATPKSAPMNLTGAMGGGINTLFSDTDNPDEPITAGASVGPGPGPEVLPKGITGDVRDQENLQIIAKYIPALVDASRIPGAPDSYKRFVNSLLEQMPQGQM